MAKPQSVSKNSRPRDNDDDDDNGESSRKHQKLDHDTNAPEPRSITNICYDVLERIFEFLDMESLLNVANTCTRLQIAAAAKFRDDYRNKQINLEITKYSRISHSEMHNEIRVCGLEYCLPFLRCFGEKCLNLIITADRDAPAAQHDHLDQYINRYCADTLTSIRFVEKPSFKLANSPKPFKNVTDVYIGHLNLGPNLPLIAELFPNLNHLVMYFISIDEHCTAVSFPHLKDLAINEYRNLKMDSLLKLLHANRQLRDFQIQLFNSHGPITLSAISNMIAENPLITKFWLSSRHEIPVDTNELWRFAIERPEMIDLDLSRFIIEVDDVILFIRQMKSLRNFVFKLTEHNEYDRLVNQLSDQWRHRIIFNETSPNYSLNNVVTLNR